MFRKLLLPLFVAALAPALAAQGPDSVMNARIRTEGMDHSKIMWIEHYLTDVYGPRPIGSPNHVAAANWAVKTMTEFGLKNAHLEPFTWKGVGWMPGRAVGYTTSPYTSNIKFEANPWSPSTRGTVRGPVISLVAPVNPTEDELDAYLTSMAPKVKGGIVMVGEPAIAPVDFCPTASRIPDSVARAQFAPRDPNAAPAAGGRGGRGGAGAGGCARAGGRGRGALEPTPAGHLSAGQVNQRLLTLVRDNMPALRLMYQGGGRIPGEIVAQNGAGQIYNDTTPQPPSVILRNDDAGRIFRTTQDGTPVMVEFNMQNQYYPQGKTSYVTVAEIPGTDKGDEVLMLGGHLDSWTSATGATDNAIGCAIMMEAARILEATGAKPRRTIRVALWSGEEEGLLGSFAYVANHFGSAEAPKPDFNKLDAYWNIDDGTGLVRGASIFGPPAAATILAEYLKPWESWGVYGAGATTARVEGGSDNGAFAVAGLPGIGTRQDGIEYNSTTWHSNLDTYERIIPDDVMKNAVITASVMLGLANRDEMLPRFSPSEMPKVPEAGAGRAGRGVAAGGAPPVFEAPGHIFVVAKTVPFVEKAALATAARGETMAPTAAIVSRPKHGKVIFRGDGSFTYTPTAGFIGADTFTYNLTRNGEKSTDGTVKLLVH